MAKRPQTINLWRTIAPNISSGTLSTLFIECSWPSGRPDSHLYGHLTPEHLHDELVALATEVVKHRRHVLTIGTTTVPSMPTSLAAPLSGPTPVPVPVSAPIVNLNHNADSVTTLPSRSSSPTHSTRASLKRGASSFFNLLSPNKGHKRKSSEALNGNGNGNVSGSKGWSKQAKTDHLSPSLPAHPQPQPHRPASPTTTCTTNDSESIPNTAAVPTVDVPAQPSLPADESINGVLQGLKVYVMHCKEDVEGRYPGRPIGHVISAQVRALVESSGLGCEVLHADQGMRIGEYLLRSLFAVYRVMCRKRPWLMKTSFDSSSDLSCHSV